MPTSVTTVVLNASKMVLQSPVTVYGNQEYTITTDFIRWGENGYRLSKIASTFGTPVNGETKASKQILCGESTISMFDYGLLYSVFCAMRLAGVELGESFDASTDVTDQQDIHVAWLGNDLVVYSLARNLMLPATNPEVENACGNKTIELANFVDNRKFYLQREGHSFVISTEKNEFVCRFKISNYVVRNYHTCFTGQTKQVVDDPETPWDESSGLGALIAESTNYSSLESIVMEYSKRPSVEAIVSRSDLIIQPNRKYQSQNRFSGSICYTDQEQIVLVVNIRDDLFIYRPWFDGCAKSDIKTYSNPDYTKFYDVTEECKHIEEFAKTVVVRPLSVAQFDLEVFSRIKRKFFNLELKRLPLQSCFGKMVIPEKVLLREISGDMGETMYFAVPVGIIANKVICLNSEGYLETCPISDWSSEYVYMEGDE